MDTGRAIDQVQFGVSVNLGDIGKVGLGYESVEDETVKKPDTMEYTTVINGKQKVTAGLSGTSTLNGMSSLGGTASLTGVSGEISLSDLVAVLSGDVTLQDGYSISVTDASVKGSINATVNLSNYDSTTLTQEEKPQVRCEVFDSDGAYDSVSVELEGQCGPQGDADTNIYVPTPIPGAKGTDRNSDFMLANNGVNSKHTSTFVGDIVADSVMYMVDGKKVDRKIVKVPVNSDTGEPITVTNPDCSLPYVAGSSAATERNYLCGESVQYFDGDEMVSGTLTITANVALDGTTLMVDGGDLVVMKGDVKTEMSIADVLDVEISADADLDSDATVMVTVDTSGATIDNSLVTVDHDGVTVDLDGVTVDVNADSLTATTTAEKVPGGNTIAPGYQATHVSVQLNLGAVTLGLGYSEKERNVSGSMDQKTTYVGASGSIGDTGMGWRAWTRDITNEWDADKEEYVDSSPWGIGINKDLGGGAFTFVEHHNADKGASGNTIVALGVNF